MNQAPPAQITFSLAGEHVVIDPDNLRFNERNLSEWLQHEPGWIHYFSMKLQMAEKALLIAEMNYDGVYSDKFRQFKNEGAAVALAEAQAKTHEAVVEKNKLVINARYMVGVLKSHLKAWDKAHEAAISLGHTLRKEMERLGTDIYMPGGLRSKMYETGSDRIDNLIEELQEGDSAGKATVPEDS